MNPVMGPEKQPELPLFKRKSLLSGTRLGLAVSGGADSVALLCMAHRLADAHGWGLRVLHLQHGLRGEESRADAAFVRALAERLGLACEIEDRDTLAAARERKLGLEETGRLLRYQWFGALLAANQLDAVATGHTLDDQAETILARMLRGAWTSGLAGIHPVVAARDFFENSGSGRIVRPLLATRRAHLRAWLTSIGQNWREDASNNDLQFTRNRIRHRLLPALRAFNPRVDEQLAQTAELARADEQYWEAEVSRLLPGLLLPGRPVRGGGRASSTLGGERSLAVEVERLRGLPLALLRRLIRGLALQLGVSLNYDETLRAMGLLEGSVGSTPRREQLAANLRAERTPRELRFVLNTAGVAPQEAALKIPVPGSGSAFGTTISLHCDEPGTPAAVLRAAAPSDRVRLRHSSGAPKRVKEVLERMGVPAPDRSDWPVLEWQGEIVWMRGAVLEATDLSNRLKIEASLER
jgi:tRNA(Ile)-lysidine synthase